jgi:hypothetical protein
MNRPILSFVAAAVLLQACATAPTTPATPIANEPALEVTPITWSGDYSHEVSRFRFPAEVAEFRRVTLAQRGKDGKRVIAGYVGGPPECLTALTLWVDPASGASDTEKLDAAFARAKADVGRLHPAAALEREQAGNEAPLPHRRADYLDADRRVDLVIFLVDRDWLLKYRVVYPARCVDDVDARIKRFFDSWRRGP